MSVCVREREIKREREQFVCVREREIERESSLCVCVCEREIERERAVCVCVCDVGVFGNDTKPLHKNFAEETHRNKEMSDEIKIEKCARRAEGIKDFRSD